MMNSVISLKDVVKIYEIDDKNDVLALDHVDFDVKSGEFISICGVSGSGKSTLLHIMGCLDRVTSGDVVIDGQDVLRLNDRQLARIRNKSIGFVLQDFGLIPYRTAFENVMVPLYFTKDKLDKKARVDEMLELLGIKELRNRNVNKMSGGQKQRVAIARALVNNPQIILADEPTGQLDSNTKREIIDIFLKIKDLGKTVVVVTHDVELANQADRVVYIEDGKIDCKKTN